MNNQPTPETDDLARGNHVVPTEWAQQLERERDEARRKLNKLDVISIHSCHNECQRPICVLRRERDEARVDLQEWKTLCLWGGTPEHIHDFIKGQQTRIRHLECERDEAREVLRAVIKTGKRLERERDEAREHLKLSAVWQSLRDSQDEVLRLTFENRELRNLSNE